jgi:PPK2 family polyphosphate:nucleotide phosphotransferase
MSYANKFLVEPKTKVKLNEIDPSFKSDHHSHQEAQEELNQGQATLRKLQELFYADGRRSLLICLQGMDTAGKDGTINHIFGAMNPQGCSVVPFKEPSREEKAHDFLWRIHQGTPRRGQVTIFNRSHYEDVLVVRVHKMVPESVWSARYDQINDFEKTLVANNTHILKFFLHISREEQLERFKDRLEDPAKQWKISDADYSERKLWSDYQAAYEDALSQCSTRHAPWYVIPSNHKWFRDLAITRIVCQYLEGLDLKFPEPSVDIAQIRREFHEAKKS